MATRRAGRSRRSGRTRTGIRFLDSEDSFQKLDIKTQNFASFAIYKHVRKFFSMNFSSIEDLLYAELNTNNVFRTCWEEAIKELYEINEEEESEHDLPQFCQLAIVAYTLDTEVRVRGKKTKLFADFNNECRNLIKYGVTSDSDWQNFPYKSLYALLARSIHGIDNNPDVKSTLYYRGMSGRLTNLKEGDYVFSKHFLSCTVDKKVAKRHMNFKRSHGDKNKGHAGTLITFEGTPLAACGIIELSAFPDEEEMLIFPWSIFKVKEVVLGNQMDKVTFRSSYSSNCFIKNLPYSGRYTKYGINIRNGS